MRRGEVSAAVVAVACAGCGGTNAQSAEIGDRSSAYAWSLTSSGTKVDFDLVLFRAGRYMGEPVYTALGPPPLRAVQAFAQAAAKKAATGSTARIPHSISIASAPMQTVATALGAVVYRVIGTGSPLLLIMGYGATMRTWDPRFVDALARRHRVVIFDNAGSGGTSMIAEALAVRHPAQVRSLILCAAYPGNGTSVRPAQSALDELNSGARSQEMSSSFHRDRPELRTATWRRSRARLRRRRSRSGSGQHRRPRSTAGGQGGTRPGATSGRSRRPR